jgi:hypothetical protein
VGDDADVSQFVEHNFRPEMGFRLQRGQNIEPGGTMPPAGRTTEQVLDYRGSIAVRVGRPGDRGHAPNHVRGVKSCNGGTTFLI